MKRTLFAPHDSIFMDHTKSNVKFNMPIQHYHAGYEIYLQLDGRRYMFYDNVCYTLNKGDMVIVCPFDIHYAQSGESDFYDRVIINFLPENLGKILDDAQCQYLLSRLTACVVHLDDEQMERMYDCWKRVKMYTEEKGVLAEKLLYGALIDFLWTAAKFIGNEKMLSGENIPPNVEAVINYINKSYSEELNLDKICAIANTSKFHLCHIFKEVTGATIMEYLNNVRLAKAHSLIMNTDSTIEEIAEISGFVSGTNLNRAFKKVYGMSPRQFKKTKRLKENK